MTCHGILCDIVRHDYQDNPNAIHSETRAAVKSGCSTCTSGHVNSTVFPLHSWLAYTVGELRVQDCSHRQMRGAVAEASEAS